MDGVIEKVFVGEDGVSGFVLKVVEGIIGYVVERYFFDIWF